MHVSRRWVSYTLGTYLHIDIILGLLVTVQLGTDGLDLVLFGVLLLVVILLLPQGIVPTLRALDAVSRHAWSGGGGEAGEACREAAGAPRWR